MQKFQFDGIILVLSLGAAVLSLGQLSGPESWMSGIVGLALLVVLFSFDHEGYRGVFQSLAFAAVCGFCAAIACGAVLKLMASEGEVHLADNRWLTKYVPLVAVFATAAFWAIDVMRMNARKAVPIHVPRALGETSILSAPEPAAPPRVSYVPPQPAPAPVFAPAPQPVQNRVVPQPVQSSGTPGEPPSVPVSSAARDFPTATSLFTVPQSASAPTPDTSQPAPPATPATPSSGKEALIYVSLLGEGLNVMRTVRAEPLGRDYYRIIEEMPEGESWQFQPGQVVRCKKKNLSSGKAMVAMEEAPRAI